MIENERKYGLRDPRATRRALEAAFGEGSALEQHYLPGHGRIRRGPDGCSFNYKHPLPDGSNVEVETAIDTADFEALRGEATASLRKIRWSVAGLGPGERWDIDVFLDEDGSCGLAMAEAEMPIGQDEPSSLPWFATARQIVAIDRGDRRFTSHALCDPSHRRRMAELIETGATSATGATGATGASDDGTEAVEPGVFDAAAAWDGLGSARRPRRLGDSDNRRTRQRF